MPNQHRELRRESRLELEPAGPWFERARCLGIAGLFYTLPDEAGLHTLNRLRAQCRLLSFINPISPGKSIGDYNQLTFDEDISYEWRHGQFWDEIFFARLQVLNVGDADTLAYCLETKYKITSQLFAAVRWNQEFFANINNGVGGETPWDRDVWRVEAALCYRFTRHLQAKVQYRFTNQQGTLQQGQQLVAGQITLRF
jgi:hypothetical protein